MLGPSVLRALGFTVKYQEAWGLAVLETDGALLMRRTAESFAREFPAHAADLRPRASFQSSDLDADARALREADLKVSDVFGSPDGARALLPWDRDDNPFFVWHAPGAPF